MYIGEEFVNATINHSVKCARIVYQPYIYHEEAMLFQLNPNWSPNDLLIFLSNSTVEFNTNNPTESLTGTIWLMDGSWMERESGKWVHYSMPEFSKQ